MSQGSYQEFINQLIAKLKEADQVLQLNASEYNTRNTDILKSDPLFKELFKIV